MTGTSGPPVLPLPEWYAVRRGRQRLRRAARGVVRNLPALLGAAVFLVIALAAVFAGSLSRYDPAAQDTAHRLLSISRAHLLGTDQFGRDIFTRLLYGARPALAVALVSIVVALAAGACLGTVAGYRGGAVEAAIMRLMDLMLAFPLILLAIMIVAVLGPSVLNLILAIAISQLPLFARLAHALTLAMRTRDSVQAARCLGASDARILRLHIVPNILTPLLVQAAATVALAMLNAAALNFLGLGIQPPSPDWGAMVSDFRRFVFDRPELPLYPGLAVAITVLSINLMADGIVDVVDPTVRRGGRGR